MQYQHARLVEMRNKAKEKQSSEDQQETQNALQRLEEEPISPNARQKALDTAFLLYQLQFGAPTILGALVEPLLREEKTNLFGTESLMLAKGVQQMNAIIEKNFEKIQPAILSKLLIANAKDIRIMIIKIATALIELRFAERTETDKKNAEITLKVLVPICHKLGLHIIRWELEDLAMKQLEPEIYEKLKKQLNEKREKRVERLEELEKKIKEILQKNNVDAFVTGRVKNLYRIRRKMEEQNKKLSEISDMIAVRIICPAVKDCYSVLGSIQQEFEEIKGGYNDYIAHPKQNGYKSIHTDIKWKDQSAEIQIRTWDMHKEAEDGLAAHWEYKQYAKDPEFDPRLSLAKQISDWVGFGKNRELMKSIRIQFEKSSIFVFTPHNELIQLPEGATPVDFAFAVHSQLGERCEKAKVNNKVVPLNHSLENGDLVEIIASDKKKPKRSWLSFVKTEKARAKIKTALKMEQSIKKRPVKKAAILSRKKQLQMRLAHCCNPLPGDDVIAIKTTKRKIVVHRKDCPNYKKSEGKDGIKISDDQFPKQAYNVEIRVKASNEAGILASILNEFAKVKCPVNSTNVITKANQFSCRFNVQIKKTEGLKKVLERIRNIKGVIDAKRV